jgi:hypothetical protein
MKDELTIPEHFPDLKEEGLKMAAKRRETYSLVRDKQAKEYNDAIVSRLEREKGKENQV